MGPGIILDELTPYIFIALSWPRQIRRWLLGGTYGHPVEHNFRGDKGTLLRDTIAFPIVVRTHLADVKTKD